MRFLGFIICLFCSFLSAIAQSEVLLAKSDSLFAQGQQLFKQEKYIDAIPFFEQSDHIDKFELDSLSRRRTDTYQWLSYCYFKTGNYDRALTFAKEMLPVIEKVLGKKHKLYASTINDIANFNGYLENYEEAIKYGLTALELQEQLFGKENQSYLTTLNNLVLYNVCLRNYQQAIELGTMELELVEKAVGKEHLIYLNVLADLAVNHSYAGNYAKASQLMAEAFDIFEKQVGGDSDHFIVTIHSVAKRFSEAGNYEGAKKLAIKNLEIIERTKGADSFIYASILHNLADYTASLGNPMKARALETQALSLIEKTMGKDSREYTMALNSLSSFYSAAGEHTKALRYGKEGLDVFEKLYGKNNSEYALSLSRVANCYAVLGNFPEAINLGIQVLNILENTLGTDNTAYANALDIFAYYNFANGNYDIAMRLGTQCLELREKLLGKDHPDYVKTLGDQVIYAYSKGDFAEAIRLGEKVVGQKQKLLGSRHPDIARSLIYLASSYAAAGRYEEAIKSAEKALGIVENNLGKSNPDYSTIISDLAKISDTSKDWARRNRYAVEANGLLTDMIRRSFTTLTGYERLNWWNSKKYWFEDWIHSFSFSHPDRELTEAGCDAVLFAKGILLNSEREFSQFIAETNDQQAIETFEQLRQTRRELNRLYEKPVAERRQETDSLENLAYRLEQRLLDTSKVYGDFTRNLNISWRDVKRSLGNRDVAIEFVSFPSAKDSVVYAAYVIAPQLDSPAMVPLFEGRQLEGIKPSAYYTSPDLSSLVWSRLDGYIRDTDNIYFSPAGELYNIAIEYLPDYGGEGLISDNHNLYRLSSTRELAKAREGEPLQHAVLYGGLKYDTDADLLIEDARNYPDAVRDLAFDDHSDLRKAGIQIKELPETRVEVERIAGFMDGSKIRTDLYMDTEGTEGSFKALSGRKVNLAHIATHGFYWTEKDATRSQGLSFLMSDDKLPQHVEDKALTRSGLLMTGAKNTLAGKELPGNVNDGVLTAREIAALDFRGLDMVILSACQTGLGEISGEGVSGLQRGFKKAGANTLMTSLWKVSDRATQMLMTKFYEHFLSGKSKLESLRLAQKHVREYEEPSPTGTEASADTRGTDSADGTAVPRRPFAHPKFWAAFILLDAL